MPIPSRITRLRKAQGLSQRSLAKLSGVSHAGLAGIECGRRGRGTFFSTLEKLARALGLRDVDDLQHGTLDEVDGAVAMGDERGAVIAALELLQDMRKANLAGRCEAILDLADPSRWPETVIVVFVENTSWLPASKSRRLFVRDCQRVLASRLGESVAMELVRGFAVP